MSDLLERLSTDVGGRYVIEGELGRGGMATVYLARDLMDERRVAIKVLDPELAAAVGGERFRREIEIARRLQHPNILGIYEHGEAAGSLYYVMPYVQGESLRARLDREKQLPVEEAVRYACEVADALAYAHAQGVVHRDIKPENVLLEDGHAVVADFGIARAASSADQATLTKTGVAMGTPPYMSPEQIYGEKNIDGRTDQYALGCMLHEMLAGQPPFVGPHAQSLMAQHALDDPPLVTRFRPSTPTHVEDAILTALAKQRPDRFPTLGDFAAALRQPGSHTSMMRATRTRAVPAPPPPRAPVWKRAIPIAAAMLLGIATTAGAWYYFVQPNVRRDSIEDAAALAAAKRIAVLYFTTEDSTLRPVADGLTEALIDRLAVVQGLTVRTRGAVAAYRGSGTRLDSIGRSLNVGRVVTGEVSEEGGRIHVDLTLRDVASNSIIKRFSAEEPRARALALRDSVASGLAEALRGSLGEDIELAETRASTSSLDAWTTLQRAKMARRDADAAFTRGDAAATLAMTSTTDSLARRAAAIDPAWALPWVEMAALDYRRAEREFTRDRKAAAAWLDSAMAYADSGLARDEANADALDWRGTARFAKTRLNLVADRAVVDAMLAEAERDLLDAVERSPSQASAFNTLSRIEYARKNVAAAGRYAEKALAADPFLTNAAATYYRVFVSSYDLGSFPDARQWCARGAERYPDNSLFVECRILLLLASDDQTDPAAAWRLVGDFSGKFPPAEREFRRRYAEIFVAGRLARAGLRDSADRVLVRARAGADIDPHAELMGYEALIRAHMGQIDQAIALIQRYVADNPDHVSGFTGTRTWWWAPLQNDARFRAVTVLAR